MTSKKEMNPFTNVVKLIDLSRSDSETKVDVDIVGRSRSSSEEEKNRTTAITAMESDEALDEVVRRRRIWFASPRFVLVCSMLEISMLIYTLVYFNVIEGDFFKLGPPIQLFQYKITNHNQYWGILVMFFIHQLMYTWLNEVVGPWMLNEVQNPSNTRLSFDKPQTLILINLYYIYYSLNSVMLVNVSLSQLSFLVVMLLADIVATTVLNVHYIWNKKYVAVGSCLALNKCKEKLQEEGRVNMKLVKLDEFPNV